MSIDGNNVSRKVSSRVAPSVLLLSLEHDELELEHELVEFDRLARFEES